MPEYDNPFDDLLELRTAINDGIDANVQEKDRDISKSIVGLLFTFAFDIRRIADAMETK